jgi:hypothetical protein
LGREKEPNKTFLTKELCPAENQEFTRFWLDLDEKCGQPEKRRRPARRLVFRQEKNGQVETGRAERLKKKRVKKSLCRLKMPKKAYR